MFSEGWDWATGKLCLVHSHSLALLVIAEFISADCQHVDSLLWISYLRVVHTDASDVVPSQYVLLLGQSLLAILVALCFLSTQRYAHQGTACIYCFPSPNTLILSCLTNVYVVRLGAHVEL